MSDGFQAPGSGPRLLSRRQVTTTLAGLSLGLGAAGAVRAQDFARPPVFRTQRSQFVTLKPRPAFHAMTLTGLDGHPVDLAPVPGKILLVNLWATWCELCLTELPMLEKVQAELGAQVTIAALSIDTGDAAHIQAYLKAQRVQDLWVVRSPRGQTDDATLSGIASLPAYGVPMTYLITPSGWIAGYIYGVAAWLTPEGKELLAFYRGA